MNTPDTEWKKEKEEFNKMWNEGKFHWNENQKTEINPQRIWNVFIQPMLSSRDTHLKERVRKEVEGMKKDFVPADLIWEGDEEQEVGEWKYVPKEDGMYCLNCERFVPEEGCICGLISFEALDTLLDNLK